MKLKIMHIYPDLLNLYGDKGNIECLRKRLLWRGIDAEVIECNSSCELDLSDTDIALIGGGGEREERLALSKLMQKSGMLKEYINSGGVLVALCGGFSFVGNYTFIGNEKTDALGLVDIYTEPSKTRFSGDVILKSDDFGYITGFENHGVSTYTGDYAPLGEVICGGGNNGEDSKEGLIYKNVFATNLHGPLFPKNPKLCDSVLKRALERKYPDFEGLKELDDALEEKASDVIIKRYIK